MGAVKPHPRPAVPIDRAAALKFGIWNLESDAAAASVHTARKPRVGISIGGG